ncbi:MAG TPA: sigma factor-like helix-turn-helix DNA-binding protein, partial [Fibrobacteraceae bacterium]|nr:sigma factor-like helix-turn-helix DNA-binding protein [Fibrobacteraceae bacterium]
NRIRDRKRRASPAEEGLLERIASLEDDFARLEARSVLDRLFLRHSESSRVVATLYFVDGMTLAEVARETHLSVSGVRKRLRLLRSTLNLMEVQ